MNLSEGYKNQIIKCLKIAKHENSPEYTVVVLEYLIKAFYSTDEKNPSKDGVTVKEVIEGLGKEAAPSWKTIKDSLEVLVELGMATHGNPGAKYDQKYKFPNGGSINRSFELPMLMLYQFESDLFRETQSQIESVTSNRYPPFVEIGQEELYREGKYRLEKEKEVRIFSHSPGILLITEYDEGKSERKLYFDKLEERLKANKKTDYVFDYDETVKILSRYTKEQKEKSLALYSKFFSLFNKSGNEIHFARKANYPSVVIGSDSILLGTWDDEEKTRLGLIIYNKLLRKRLQIDYEQYWNRTNTTAKENTLQKIITSAK